MRIKKKKYSINGMVSNNNTWTKWYQTYNSFKIISKTHQSANSMLNDVYVRETVSTHLVMQAYAGDKKNIIHMYYFIV